MGGDLGAKVVAYLSLKGKRCSWRRLHANYWCTVYVLKKPQIYLQPQDNRSA